MRLVCAASSARSQIHWSARSARSSLHLMISTSRCRLSRSALRPPLRVMVLERVLVLLAMVAPCLWFGDNTDGLKLYCSSTQLFPPGVPHAPDPRRDCRQPARPLGPAGRAGPTHRGPSTGPQ
uniref:Uncharacterized protein n=1 Tax=uncultured marine virus TaxID=186617 RepID=A0A0F7L854_9VIRU|nr:hypothetical protein [uncultured marine virus]